MYAHEDVCHHGFSLCQHKCTPMSYLPALTCLDALEKSERASNGSVLRDSVSTSNVGLVPDITYTYNGHIHLFISHTVNLLWKMSE